jgi:hypothetical protein
MPQFDSTTRTKIEALRTLRASGVTPEVYEIVEIAWPAPTDTIYYGTLQVDEVASAPPPVSPIVTRLAATSLPNWFLPLGLGTLIGDQKVELTFFDGDGTIGDLVYFHGEGIKTIIYYWFPQVTLLLPVWLGHLKAEENNSFGTLKLQAIQGFRAADATVPGRAHYEICQRVFGGLLDTQAEIDEHGCNYNRHIGGSIGTLNPLTGLPWTFCPRLLLGNCIDRGINPLRHYSHLTQISTVINDQTHGGRLYSTSIGNNTALKEPVRVVMGTKRIYNMQVMAFRRDMNNNHPDQGFFFAMYEGCEGPISGFQDSVVTLGSASQAVVPLHFAWRLGTPEQSPASTLSTHGFSNTAYFSYNFGWVNPSDYGPADASAAATVIGLNDIRVYSDDVTYIETWTSNRAWQIARLLCEKKWGYGLDYSRLNIQSFIDAAAWCDTYVTFVDPDGTEWPHVRAESHVELVGRKVQQQIDDLCLAGFLSRPFIFDGKICIEPLRALTTDELAAVPVFTDEGENRNVIVETHGGVEISSLTFSRKSDLDLTNRIECQYDDAFNAYVQTPLNPVEDIDAELHAGRIVGDFSRKKNKKEYTLLGTVYKAQGIKTAWGIMDRGEYDEGGLQNNLRISFKCWFADALDVHPHKVIKYESSQLARYPYTYFRIIGDGIKKLDDLTYEITAQAYNEEYMESFEIEGFGTGGGGTGGGAGQIGCALPIGTISYVGGILTIPIGTC